MNPWPSLCSAVLDNIVYFFSISIIIILMNDNPLYLILLYWILWSWFYVVYLSLRPLLAFICSNGHLLLLSKLGCVCGGPWLVCDQIDIIMKKYNEITLIPFLLPFSLSLSLHNSTILLPLFLPHAQNMPFFLPHYLFNPFTPSPSNTNSSSSLTLCASHRRRPHNQLPLRGWHLKS